MKEMPSPLEQANKNTAADTYCIADLTVRMHTFGRTAQQSLPYRTSHVDNPNIVIENDRFALMAKYPELSEDDCEYITTGAAFNRLLPSFGGMMVHSSAVVTGGRAYLFTAPSGTGKSTHTALWLQLLGERAFILNDDKPVLRIFPESVRVYGTPWSGKTDQNRNTSALLGGICILKRGAENCIRRATVAEALPVLLEQTQRSLFPIRTESLLRVLDRLLTVAPVYVLECLPDLAAAELAYRTLSGEASAT